MFAEKQPEEIRSDIAVAVGEFLGDYVTLVRLKDVADISAQSEEKFPADVANRFLVNEQDVKDAMQRFGVTHAMLCQKSIDELIEQSACFKEHQYIMERLHDRYMCNQHPPQISPRDPEWLKSVLSKTPGTNFRSN